MQDNVSSALKVQKEKSLPPSLLANQAPEKGRIAAKYETQWRGTMTCPFCRHREDKVIDSRESKDGQSTRRRRQCLACDRRYTTYERCDELPYMVIKKDGRREPFERQKVLNGLLRACEKRPVSMASLAQLVDDVESDVADSADREISTAAIGEKLMNRLRSLDKIAYIRFASVYRDFQDVEEFLSELSGDMQGRAR